MPGKSRSRNQKSIPHEKHHHHCGRNRVLAVAGCSKIESCGWIPVAEFNDQCDKLIRDSSSKGFFKRYPSGTTAEISKALSGQAEGGVVIMATKNSEKNDKGEIVDPWGTTIQFFFSHNAVLIRSAGPNKSFEDSRTATCDDLYRTETK